MELISQKMRRLAPELDPLRIGTGWKPEDLSKPQIYISSTFGDSPEMFLESSSSLDARYTPWGSEKASTRARLTPSGTLGRFASQIQ